MGCYDTFVGECPHCKEPFESQTKLFEDDLRQISVGKRINNYNDGWTGNIQCKEACHNCRKPVVAIIKKGVLQALVRPEHGIPYRIERAYGRLYDFVEEE